MGKPKHKHAQVEVSEEVSEVVNIEPPKLAPMRMTPDERRVEWTIMTRLFYAGEANNRLEPTTRAEGEQWLEAFGQQMEKLMDDATAIHLGKIQAAEAAKVKDPRAEAARARLAALEARSKAARKR